MIKIASTSKEEMANNLELEIESSDGNANISLFEQVSHSDELKSFLFKFLPESDARAYTYEEAAR